MRAWLIFIYLLLIELYSFISENLRMTFFQTLISFCTCSLKQQLFLCEVEVYIIILITIYTWIIYIIQLLIMIILQFLFCLPIRLTANWLLLCQQQIFTIMQFDNILEPEILGNLNINTDTTPLLKTIVN